MESFRLHEMFHRGQWNIYAVQKKIPDFCAILHDKSEIWYPFTKTLPKCDIKAGVK